LDKIPRVNKANIKLYISILGLACFTSINGCATINSINSERKIEAPSRSARTKEQARKQEQDNLYRLNGNLKKYRQEDKEAIVAQPLTDEHIEIITPRANVQSSEKNNNSPSSKQESNGFPINQLQRPQEESNQSPPLITHWHDSEAGLSQSRIENKTNDSEKQNNQILGIVVPELKSEKNQQSAISAQKKTEELQQQAADFKQAAKTAKKPKKGK
jgi:hypothetical protein